MDRGGGRPLRLQVATGLADAQTLFIASQQLVRGLVRAFGFKLALSVCEARVDRRKARHPEPAAHFINCARGIGLIERSLNAGEVLAHLGQMSLVGELLAESAPLFAQALRPFG